MKKSRGKQHRSRRQARKARAAAGTPILYLEVMGSTPSGHRWSMLLVLLGVSFHISCGSADPYGRNLVVPAGSIYDEPAQAVRALGYTIAHVDTIIGFIDAYDLRGGSTSRADRMVLDVFTEVPSGRRVVSIVGQSLTQVRVVHGLGRISGRPTTPSSTLRQDAAAVLRTLGCADVQMEQRMTPNGIELNAWCGTDQSSGDTR